MNPPFEPLPHVYPFRFADRRIETTGPASGRVRVAVSANARFVDGGRLLAVTLGEMIAQSALLLQGGDPDLGRSGFLAGIQDFTVDRVPESGDLLTVDVRLAAHLGPVVKFEGTITDADGMRVAGGAVVVREGTVPV